MARFLHHNSTLTRGKFRVVLLATFWLLGLLLGAYLHISADTFYPSMMRSAISGRVSIVGSLTVTLLPFLFSAIAVYLSQPLLLIPIAFLKGIFLSLVALGIGRTLGSAAWLILGMVMFSDFSMTLPLMFYWIRHISGFRRFSSGSCLLFCGAAGVVTAADQLLISPILAGI